jgi:hypothetical protein
MNTMVAGLFVYRYVQGFSFDLDGTFLLPLLRRNVLSRRLAPSLSAA